MTVALVQADARHLPLPDESVQCVITSPPYFGLREYEGLAPSVWGGEDCALHDWSGVQRQAERYTGKRKWQHIGAEAQAAGVRVRDVDPNAWGHPQVADTDRCTRCGAWRGCLGLEPTLGLYVEHVVEVMREVRRVLRSDGTVWLNLGDSYAAQGGLGSGGNFLRERRAYQQRNQRPSDNSFKPKDLLMVPHRVALALQADGWWVRSDVVWSKPNPMPESTTDRPTRSHEYLFLLTKSGAATYWTHRDLPGTRERPASDYRWIDRANGDAETAEEPDCWREDRERWRRVNLWEGHDYFYDADAVREPHTAPSRGHGGGRLDNSEVAAFTVMRREYNPGGRNLRSVWIIPTEPFPGAHFATFPRTLVERCLLAGTSPRACGECGAPWTRVVERGALIGKDRGGDYRGRDIPSQVRRNGGTPGMAYENRTVGFRPTCAHGSADGSARCLVLDPFAGSGTVGLVAAEHGRDAALVEASRAYCELATTRLYRVAPVTVKDRPEPGRLL